MIHKPSEESSEEWAENALPELAERYRRRRAPAAALDTAVANFASRSQSPAGQRWPLLVFTAAALCAVILLPAILREDVRPQPTLASLSLNQLNLPAPPALSLSVTLGSELAGITRFGVDAPSVGLGVPNLSQLSLATQSQTRNQEKETR